MYEEVLQLLDRDEFLTDDSDALHEAFVKHHLSESLGNQMQSIARRTRTPAEFRCLVEHRSLLDRGPTGSDLVVKKLISLSTTSFIHCGSATEHLGDVHTGYAFSWPEIGNFVKVLRRYESLVRENFIVPAASWTLEDDTNDDNLGPRYESLVIKRIDIGKKDFRLNLEIEEVERQILEIADPTFPPPAGAVEIFLPHLEHVSIDAIVRFRKQEEDAFVRYHRCLSEFFQESGRIKDERSIVECLRKVDEGVRETEAAMRALSRKQVYGGLGIGLGLSCVALCLFLPRDISEYIRAMLGGATGVALFQHLASRQDSTRSPRRADFYFPWLLHREGRQGC